MTQIEYANCKVELLHAYGSDLDIVNAARTSFGKDSEWEWKEPEYQAWSGMGDFQGIPGHVFNSNGEMRVLKEGDKRLIQFLARGYTSDEWEGIIHKIEEGTHNWDYEGQEFDAEYFLREIRGKAVHFMPFCHVFASFKIKCPIFLTRQLAKHQIGLAWSEESRRYLDDGVEFYKPKSWRKRPKGNIKQGSSKEGFADKDSDEFYESLESSNRSAISTYNFMIDEGVAPEQARMVLPLNMMTTYTWSGSLLAFSRVCNLRLDSHAQLEVKDEVARKISDQLSPYFPESWKALVHNV